MFSSHYQAGIPFDKELVHPEIFRAGGKSSA